ncbi:MAG: PilN domain-containing protein [Idiomarina sp.]
MSSATLKTAINLYVAELRPVQQRFTLKLTLLVLAGWLAVLVLATIVLSYAESSQQEQVTELNRQVSQQRAVVTELNEALQQRRGDPKIQQQLDLTRAEIERGQQLLGSLKQQQRQHQTSFAMLLTDLADITHGQLWLQDIVMEQGHLTLRGYATKAAALPAWMADFSGQPTLQNRQFAVFELRTEDKAQGLAFTISSAAATTAETEAAPVTANDLLRLSGGGEQ